MKTCTEMVIRGRCKEQIWECSESDTRCYYHNKLHKGMLSDADIILPTEEDLAA